jgi:hypothetical protein
LEPPTDERIFHLPAKKFERMSRHVARVPRCHQRNGVIGRDRVRARRADAAAGTTESSSPHPVRSQEVERASVVGAQTRPHARSLAARPAVASSGRPDLGQIFPRGR